MHRGAFNALAGGFALSRLIRPLNAQTPPDAPPDAPPDRLSARRGAGASSLPFLGFHPLGFRTEGDALLYLPESAMKFEKAPLVESLHGYRVTSLEFEEKHELPPAVASEAMRWFMEIGV